MHEQTRRNDRESAANQAANREPAEGSRETAESSNRPGGEAPRAQPCEDDTRRFVTGHDPGDEERENCSPGSTPAPSAPRRR
jgi:hypothetical protein